MNFFHKGWQKLEKVLASIISTNALNLNDFEASFVTSFKDKFRKNSQKLEIV